MNIHDLVNALLSADALGARQWVMDADDANFDWRAVPQPRSLTSTELAVAAGVIEMLASRRGVNAPAWTAQVPAAPHPVWLLSNSATMPRTRKLCEDHGPESLRRRNIFAPPEFLTAA